MQHFLITFALGACHCGLVDVAELNLLVNFNLLHYEAMWVMTLNHCQIPLVGRLLMFLVG